jgi:hypothetical protein
MGERQDLEELLFETPFHNSGLKWFAKLAAAACNTDPYRVGLARDILSAIELIGPHYLKRLVRRSCRLLVGFSPSFFI